jgi:hypothetical protein
MGARQCLDRWWYRALGWRCVLAPLSAPGTGSGGLELERVDEDRAGGVDAVCRGAAVEAEAADELVGAAGSPRATDESEACEVASGVELIAC